MGVMKNAKRNSKATSSKSSQTEKVSFSEYQFTRIELSGDDKKRFKALRESGEFDVLPIDKWLGEGYKLSVVLDQSSNATLASLSQPFRDHPNAGLILTGRGGDAVTALSVLAYKDEYLCKDGLWRTAMASDATDPDDIG